MQTFTWQFTVAENADQSILASIASPFAYVLVPIVGVLSWQLAAATITGFIAKENVVGTLAVCFVGLENLIDVDELQMIGSGQEVAGIIAITKVAALAYLVFNLYSPPCFAAIGAMNSEMKSKRWLFGGIAFQLAIAFTASYLVYTIGTLITSPSSLSLIPAIIGLVATLLMAGAIVGLKHHHRRCGIPHQIRPGSRCVRSADAGRHRNGGAGHAAEKQGHYRPPRRPQAEKGRVSLSGSVRL